MANTGSDFVAQLRSLHSTIRANVYVRQVTTDSKEQSPSYPYASMAKVVKLTDVLREVKVKGGS